MVAAPVGQNAGTYPRISQYLQQRQAGIRYAFLWWRQGILQSFAGAIPAPGSWTVAFLTGSPAEEINHILSGEHVSIYVPTTPNPTSGYFLIVPRSDVIELNMSVDDALKYVISMGVVTPHEAAVALLQEAQLPPPEK